MMSEEPQVEKSQALTKFDESTLRGIVPSQGGGSRAVFLPANFAEALEMAKLLASGIGVRPFMRGNVSACMMVVQQAVRWGMDPYAVANKAYYVNDQVAYESQLIAALINTSNEIVGRLKIEYEGDAVGKVGEESLVCRVRGRLAADPDDERVMEQALKTVKIRNSPLWTVNPKLQLAYHTQRSWARLFTPEVLLGIYTPDEIQDGVAGQIEAESTPRGGKAPDRRDFIENQAADAEPAEFSTIEVDQVEESADSTRENPENPENMQNDGDLCAEGAENAQTEPVSVDSSAENKPVSGAAGVEPEDDSDGAAGRAGEPEPAEQQGLLDIPFEPLEWATWKAESLAKIEAVKDLDAFNLLKRELEPAMDQADDDLLNEIQDALADKLLLLTPDVRSEG
jgi:hypothetical protein